MITITPAQLEHARTIAEIAEEMDRFYGAHEVEPAETRIRQISEALFSDPPSAYSLLAWDDRVLVGLASYSFLSARNRPYPLPLRQGTLCKHEGPAGRCRQDANAASFRYRG